MLLGVGLPKSLWGEVVMNEAYLINKCPLTRMEVWSGKPTYYSTLKVFGALTYVHIKQDNLDARAVKFVFIGYLEGVKGYKLWKLESRGGSRVMINMGVTFNETCMGMK